MIEYIEGTKSIVSLIPTIKNMFSKKNRTKIEMWGNWETFKNDELYINNELSILSRICANPNNKYNYSSYKRRGIHFYLIGEIGYWKLFKKYVNHYRHYIKYRKDLSIIGRIKLAYIKSKRWINKFQFKHEVDKYFKYKDRDDRIFKNSFNDGSIDMISLYMIETKKELK